MAMRPMRQMPRQRSSSNWATGLASGLAGAAPLLGMAITSAQGQASPGTETDWLGRFDNANEGYGLLGQQGDDGVRQEALDPIPGAQMGPQQHQGLLAAGMDAGTAPGGVLTPAQQATGLLSPSRASVMGAGFPAVNAAAQAAQGARGGWGGGWGGLGGGWDQMNASQRFSMLQSFLQPRRFG